MIESLRSQKKLIVWGGVHASLNPTECAELADIVCRGEGEEMMLELVERLEQGRDWRDIENTAFKENGSLQLNSLRPPIRDLDELPFPDFTFEDEYLLTRKGFVQVSTMSQLTSRGELVFNSSRGCAFHCTYCCNAKLKSLYLGKGRYVRRMSVSKLIEHTQNLCRIFPQGKYFYFIDEDFAARPVEELAQLSEEFPRKVGLPFTCLAHPARVTQQKMDLLVKAGLFRIYMGIESGSEHTKREIYDRHVSNEVVLQAARTISGYPQLLPSYFFIIANPYEEKDDLIATARLISELPYGAYVMIYNLMFFPGSALYERAMRDGLIAGTHDCGYELDFHGGLDYKQHAWKQKNLYLNGLIFLMEGWCVRHRIGILPRLFVNTLLAPDWTEFNENHLSGIRIMISIRFLVNSIRHWGARWLKKIIGNPVMVYNLGYHLRARISSAFEREI